MAWTIDVAFVQQFDANIHQLAQEDAQAIRNAVRVKPGVRGKNYKIERLNGIEMIPINSRHSTTTLTPFTHSRRQLSVADYGLSEMIDDLDEVKMLISPQSDYAQNFAKAYNRKIARIITTAMLGNALSVGNDDTTTNVALPAAQQIANSGTSMTMAKLRQASYILDNNGIPPTDRFLAMSPYASRSLLADSQITSADYSSLQALKNGRIPDGAQFMGFTFMTMTDALGAGATMADPILPKAGNIRSCLAWHKNSACLGIARDFTVEMPRDPSYWNNLRVIVKVSAGAVRVEDQGVVQIDIDETA